MLARLKDLEGMSINAVDGQIGKITNVYFDDEKWVLRYFIVNTGGLLLRHETLLSPIAMNSVDWKKGEVNVRLTREQVEKSPEIDTQKPVERQMEEKYYQYYGWANYWNGIGLWGNDVYPGALADADTFREYEQDVTDPAAPPNTGFHRPGVEEAALAPGGPKGNRGVAQDMNSVPKREPENQGKGDPHLRSAKAVRGYTIHAMDGEIGHVSDFLIEEQSWSLKYLILDTRNWLPGKHVLLAPNWVEKIRWAEAETVVKMDRDTIRNAPAYDPHLPFGPEEESTLLEYYMQHATT